MYYVYMVYLQTIRIPDDVHARLRELYATTYAAHRLSWNAWLVMRLAGADVAGDAE